MAVWGRKRTQCHGINGNQSNNSASRAGAVYFLSTMLALVARSLCESLPIRVLSIFEVPCLLIMMVRCSQRVLLATTLLYGHQWESDWWKPDDNYGWSIFSAGPEPPEFAKRPISNLPLPMWGQFWIFLSLNSDGTRLAVGFPVKIRMLLASMETNPTTAVSVREQYSFLEKKMALWFQESYIKASNTDGSDVLESVPSVRAARCTLPLAYNEASNATGIDGNQNNNSALGAGAVYIIE